MSIVNTDVFSFSDISAALTTVTAGDTLNLYIMNDIVFSTAVTVTAGVEINVLNANETEPVVLFISAGGAFRHFTTGNANPANAALSVNPGIIIDGGETGGGIQVTGSGFFLTLDSCIIRSCFNGLNGGGVLVGGNTTRSMLNLNQAVISGCRAGISGGAVFASACDIEINGGELSENTANSSGGGFIAVRGANNLGSTMTANGLKVTGNTVVAGDGGGISVFDTITVLENCEIELNSGDNYGGGIFAFNQFLDAALNSLILRNCIISRNTTRNTGAGIGVLNELSEFIIDNSSITHNVSDSTAAGTKQGGGIYLANGSTLLLTNSTVSRNMAGTSGGGIFVNLSNLVVTGGSVISNNEAMISAGGIYGYQGVNITIEGRSAITGNQAHSGGDSENAARGGGGIALLAFGFVSTLTVREESQISGNSSVSYGGGIWTYPNFGPENNVIIQNSVIEENTANYGGGISMGLIPDTVTSLTLDGAVLSNNTAFKDGGGIIAANSAVAIRNSRIIGNRAGRDGGGIYTNALENVTVDAGNEFAVRSATVFSGNTAQNYAYWTITEGNESDIHNSHIFTGFFSSFIPVQTPPPEIWNFLNAYNNYDINFLAMPLKTVTVRYVDVNNNSHVIHQTVINSFLNAVVAIFPKNEIIDVNGVVWSLEPSDQPEQTVVLSDINTEYTVTFFYGRETSCSYVVVTECFITRTGCRIMNPSCSIIECGGSFTKTAPNIINFTPVGFCVNCGMLQCETTANIDEILCDIIVKFVYDREC